MKQRPSFPARLKHAGTVSHVPVVSGAGAGRLVVPCTSSTAASSGARPVPTRPIARDMSAAMPEAAALRRNMVRKIAGQGVSDKAVLSAMGAVERHRFIDSALRAQAYEDTSLPIGLGQTISKPGVVSRMIELLRNGRDGPLGRVLEVGTGCGYQAAVLSLLAREVYSIERLRGLHDKARENLRPLRLANVHLLFGDGMAGFAKGAPYAAIIAAAGGDAVPQAWIDQLAVGGRLVAPVSMPSGAPGRQALLVIDKTVQGLREFVLEAVQFVPLKSGVA